MEFKSITGRREGRTLRASSGWTPLRVYQSLFLASAAEGQARGTYNLLCFVSIRTDRSSGCDAIK